MNGTSTLRNHLTKLCKKSPLYNVHIDKKQKTLVGMMSKSENEEGGKRTLVAHAFDQKKCRDSVVRMIVKDEHTFCFVEGEGFIDFIRTNLFEFNIPSRFTIGRDVFQLYP